MSACISASNAARTAAATLDSAPGTTGLLMVSGGNEIRAGAFNGQSRLAAEIAAAGFPVFRFDRRGIGDSEGTNRGFANRPRTSRRRCSPFAQSHPVAARGRVRQLRRGQRADAGCGRRMRCAGAEQSLDDRRQKAMLRHLRPSGRATPRNWPIRRSCATVSGRVDLKKLAGGMVRAMKPKSAPSSLAEDMRAGLDAFLRGRYAILLAEDDRTALHLCRALGRAGHPHRAAARMRTMPIRAPRRAAGCAPACSKRCAASE